MATIRLKTIKFVLSVEAHEWIKKYEKYFTDFEATPDFISFNCPFALLPKPIQKAYLKRAVRYYYIVKVMIFRDKQYMKTYSKNLPAQIYRLVEPLIRDVEIKIPQEEVQPVTRPTDIGFWRKIQYNTTYTGHFISLDMNSAEPYLLSQIHPQTFDIINETYKKRKGKDGKNVPEIKYQLASLVGKLKSKGYVELYLKVVRGLYKIMWDLGENIYKKGYLPIAIRRDAWIVLCPEKYDIYKDLGDIVDFGQNLGQFKIVERDGYIKTLDNEYNFETNMDDSLRTRHGGESFTGMHLYYLTSERKGHTIDIIDEEFLLGGTN